MRLFLSSLLLVLATTFNASADVNGKAVVSTVSCGNSVFSSADKICNLFAMFGGNFCQKTVDQCAEGSQEIFTGVMTEGTKPGDTRIWSGFGGTASIYTAANMCLLRDIKDAPIESTATATTAIGDVSIKQRVQFLSFDPKKLEWIGYHRGQACVPAIGCIDVFNQKITAKVLQSNEKASGKSAGQFPIITSFAIDTKADGINQALKVSIPAIQVYTPYGVVSATPEFQMGRSIGFVLAPFNGNTKSLMTGLWGSNGKMNDIYGRNPGVQQSTIVPSFLTFSAGQIDNRTIGYTSEIGFGSRDSNPTGKVWAPLANQEFPIRPDENFSVARSNAEKTPNASLSAAVKVAYSPVNLIPEYIRNNRYITLDFSVYAQPTIGAQFASQFHVLNYELAQGKKQDFPGGPVDARIPFMDQHKGLSFKSGSSASGLFALLAGVDLRLHLRIPLLFTTIDVDLINIHPKTVLAKAVSNGSGTGNRYASAKTQLTTATTGAKVMFQEYHTFLNTNPVGTEHIKTCLASPAVSQPPPGEPTYTPGSTDDLIKGVLYPCNICAGFNDFQYVDDNNQTQTIKGFLDQWFPASQAHKPPASRWSCSEVARSGCYDMCSYDPSTDKLTVVSTAREMKAADQAQDMPARCY